MWKHINVKQVKQGLRQKFRRKRENMSDVVKSIFDLRICERLTRLEEYENSNTLFTYVSKAIEVDTYKIIYEAWRDDKKVAIPKCYTEDRTMKFYYINSIDDMEKCTFGVYEPIESKCEEATNFSEGICLIPGFSFDRKGYRLGYGQGYYDRFLPLFQGKKIGLCYSNCMSYELPRGRFDVHAEIVINDKYTNYIWEK